MKTTAFAMALMMGGAAFAQTPAQTDTDMVDHTAHSAATTMTADAVAQPGNADPERDARGILVISDPAFVPAGWNSVPLTAVGGPLVDPTTGTVVDAAETDYPPCTADVTDNCVQTYERGVD